MELAQMKILAPVKGKYQITSPYGWRKHPITGKRRLHAGVDLVTGRAKTAVIAPEDGLIIEARKSTAKDGGYGYYVKYRGISGATHLMAHLEEGSLAVKAGDRVKQGKKLGIMGTSGASTGIHLHWEVRGKVPVDPIKWMNKQNA
jgi:murein DD-endopeptidase MepM/ murein hydrolase activator NlpD